MKAPKTIVLALLAVLISTSLVAAHDWKRKITYGNDPTRRGGQATSSYSSGVAQPEVESRRAYSYQPSPFSAGDAAVVSAPSAAMKLGDRVVATVARGQQIYVWAVTGPWVGTFIEEEGRRIGGWILVSDLVVAAR